MRILIDSNRFIDFCAGVPSVVDAFEQAALLVVPFIVLAEIRVGAQSIKRGDAQARILGELLQQPGVRVAHSSDTTTHHYDTLYARLKKAGRANPDERPLDCSPRHRTLADSLLARRAL